MVTVRNFAHRTVCCNLDELKQAFSSLRGESISLQTKSANGIAGLLFIDVSQKGTPTNSYTLDVVDDAQLTKLFT